MRKRIASFKHALNGLIHLIRQETNARIHVTVGAVVIIGGWYLGIDGNEWVAVILCIGFVIATEALNTAIEHIGDYISPAYHTKIKLIKDLGAAAVFISAVTSLLVGACIFVPRLLKLL